MIADDRTDDPGYWSDYEEDKWAEARDRLREQTEKMAWMEKVLTNLHVRATELMDEDDITGVCSECATGIASITKASECPNCDVDQLRKWMHENGDLHLYLRYVQRSWQEFEARWGDE